jgi:lysophospholipase L1-like esterase
LIYKYQENDGYVGYENGIISSLGDTKCTDFLPIKKGMTVKVSGISFEPSDYRGLAIYNKDKIFKNGYQYNKNNEYTFDVSEDGYLRATIVGKQIKVIANQNGIVKALIEVSEDTQKEIKREVNTLISEEYGEEKQLEITETKEGYAVKSDGSKENAGWISCLKFNCEAHQKIYTKNAHAHKNYPWIVLYDRNNNVIGSVNINEDSSAEIIAPNNVSYGWMNCYELVSYAQTQYLVKTIKNEYLPEKLKKLIIESNPLVNLLENGGYINIFNKIACIGDSLTEGVFEYTENGEVKYAGKPQGFEPYSYPSQLARMTGATVGNYGVGGATAKSWLETTACTDCFKEENKAQAYIIALGTNDTDYDGDVNTDIDVSNYNNNVDTFVGNYAKIIQKCLELQPKAKIFVVTIPKTRTDYHNAWTTGNSKIKAVAEKLGVYVLDVYTYSESYDNPDAYKNHFYLGGHRNAIGYRRTAMEYATYISWIIYNNPDDFRNVQYIGTDYNYTN